MASVSGVTMSEEHFLCSICLDVFTEPVTIPCGHNFCKVCITQYWDSNVTCNCPLCKNSYSRRPDLRVNTMISEMAALYKRSPERRPSISDSSHKHTVSPGQVPCDICPDAAKHNALKSCLVCLASFCETHLEPHRRVATCKQHKLIDPVVNLEARMCKNHGKLLEIFCRSDQECICVTCLKTEHKAHDTVLLEEEYKTRQAKVSQIKSDAQQKIWRRRCRVYELKQLLHKNNVEAAKDKGDAIKVFSALVAAVQSNQVMLIEEIEERRRTAEEQAQGFIKQLEQDITVLQRKSTELELSSHIEDHHHLLQTFLSISSIPQVLDLSLFNGIRFQSLKTVCTAVAHLEEMLHDEMEVIPRAKLKTAKRFALDVTLDPATAMSGLIISQNGKGLWARRPILPGFWDDNLFGECCVVSKKGIHSSKIYYEVEVKGNTEWKLGVIEESFKRDRRRQEYWVLQLEKEGNYSFHTNKRDYFCHLYIKPTATPLTLSMKPNKIGVFVDYNGREVSFYDVDSRALLHCFTRCTFEQTLYPMFWSNSDTDGANPAPLIITPVDGS